MKKNSAYLISIKIEVYLIDNSCIIFQIKAL